MIGPYTLEDWFRGRVDRETLDRELEKRGELGLWETIGDFVFSRDPAALRSFEVELIVGWDGFRSERHPYTIVLFGDGHTEYVPWPDRLLEADSEIRERLGLAPLPPDAPFFKAPAQS